MLVYVCRAKSKAHAGEAKADRVNRFVVGEDMGEHLCQETCESDGVWRIIAI